VFANIDLYPMIPGVAGFSINSPSFNSVKIHLKNGIVELQGGNEKLDYIQSLQINGKPFNETWIKWDDLKNGAKLDFKLSNQPNKAWGKTTVPPSYN
ncbi:MAG: glycoside hydrolase family 92 protein, partial [Pedobacter sp.]